MALHRRPAMARRDVSAVLRCVRAVADSGVRGKLGSSCCKRRLTEKRKHPGDYSLAQRVCDGDSRATRLFLDRLSCIPGFVHKRLAAEGAPREEDVLEITQSTLAALWKKLDRFDGTSSVETWAYGFCVFEVHKWRAQRQRWARVRAGGEELPEPAVEDVRARTFDRLHSALASLPGDAAEIVRLKHFEGLTFGQIGKRLGASANTAKTRYYRALAKLRERLRGERAEILDD